MPAGFSLGFSMHRMKKNKFSLIHKLATRCRTVSKNLFVYVSNPANAYCYGSFEV